MDDRLSDGILETHAFSTSSMKRKHSSTQIDSPKEARRRLNPTDQEKEASNYSLSDSPSDSDADGSVKSLNGTPLTSFSSKPSPRFPSDEKKIPCTYENCTKMFNRPAKLIQHLHSHTNSRQFACPHAPCTKDFLRKNHLRQHIKSAHSNARDYVCEWEDCGKSFLTATRLKRHQASHEGRKKYECTVTGCGQVFRKHGILQKHILKIHEGRSPFVCNMLDDESNECRAGFETAGKLKAHEGRVHGGERFWCITCSSEGQPNSITDDGEGQRDGVAFSTYAALQTHIKTDHPPTCGECGLQCSSQRELKIHVEVQHGIFGVEERRTHICDEVGCGRGFTKKGNLAVHMRTVHNGERRFVCGNLDLKSLKKVANWDGQGACGWAFSSKGNLEEHIRTAHLGLQNNRNAKKDNNNDHPRRSANRQRQVSALTRLTGSGYEAESGQDIACLQEGCDYLFARGIDLEIHLQNHHGLANLEIQILLTKHDNSVKEYSRDGFQNLVSTVAEDFEAERALDGQFVDDTTMEDDLDDAAARGGSFWIGGNYGGEGNHGGDDWLRDELEMQELIGDESEDEAMIDPALLQNS